MKLGTKKMLKIISIVIVLFCSIVVLINTNPFDEKLHPQVVEILKEAHFPPVEGNAYFATLGLMEEHGKDITQTGYKITQYHIKNSENNSNGNKLTKSQYAEFFSVNSTEDLYWMKPIITCEMVYKEDCLTNNYDGFYEPGFNSKLNNQRLQLLLGRYEKIIQMDIFQVYLNKELSIIDNYFYDVPYAGLKKLSEIQLINKFKNYSSKEFINQLYKDIGFWKMLLEQGSFLRDKMVALSAIRRDVLHLSEFMRVKIINEGELVVINKILKQLTKKDVDLSNSFETEAQFLFRTNYYLNHSSSVFENLFFQPNATSNYQYEAIFKPQLIISKLDSKKLLEIRKQTLQKTPNLKIELNYLYNPIGKILVNYAKCGGCYSDYTARAHDTRNMVKLVGIQLQTILDKGKSITSILSMSKNLNPYTDKPFEYNDDNSVSEFDCLDDFQECRVKFK